MANFDEIMQALKDINSKDLFKTQHEEETKSQIKKLVNLAQIELSSRQKNGNSIPLSPLNAQKDNLAHKAFYHYLDIPFLQQSDDRYSVDEHNFDENVPLLGGADNPPASPEEVELTVSQLKELQRIASKKLVELMVETIPYSQIRRMNTASQLQDKLKVMQSDFDSFVDLDDPKLLNKHWLKNIEHEGDFLQHLLVQAKAKKLANVIMETNHNLSGFSDQVIDTGNEADIRDFKDRVQSNEDLSVDTGKALPVTFEGKKIEPNECIYSIKHFGEETDEPIPKIGILKQSHDGKVVDKSEGSLTDAEQAQVALKQAKMLLINYTPDKGDIFIRGNDPKKAKLVYGALLVLKEGNRSLEGVKINRMVPGFNRELKGRNFLKGRFRSANSTAMKYFMDTLGSAADVNLENKDAREITKARKKALIGLKLEEIKSGDLDFYEGPVVRTTRKT